MTRSPAPRADRPERPARVVFVDDDAAMHLYVQTALQALPIELVCCSTAAQAWQALQEGPTALLIADLMLGGESGLALIERMSTGPVGLRSIRVAVTSAATDTPGIRERLRALGVWRSLQKPVELAQMETCVQDALDGTDESQRRRDAQRPDAGQHDSAVLGEPQSAAVAELFGGDHLLYARYREACIKHFPSDVAQGDADFQSGDHTATRHLVHNLRSVLRTLGEVDAARCADQLETALLVADMPVARAVWQELRGCLLRLLPLR